MMFIIPYQIDRLGNIVMYFSGSLRKPKFYTESKYLDGQIRTKLSNNVTLLLLKTEPTHTTKLTLHDLQKQFKKKNLLYIKPFYSLFEFINYNNKQRVQTQLQYYKQQITEYKTITVSNKFPPFHSNEREIYDSKDKIVYTYLPIQAVLYKAMPYTTLNTNETNPRAAYGAWFSNLETAKKYAVQVNRDLKRKGLNLKSPEYWHVYAFYLLKPVKLFNLMNFNNLTQIVKKLKGEISLHMDRASQDVTSQIQPTQIQFNKIERLIRDIKTVKMLTGYENTYRQQLQNIKEVHPVLKRKVLQSEVKILDSFYNTSSTSSDTSPPVRFKIGTSYYSNLYMDLNRISIGTQLDRVLMDVLKDNYSCHGYISPKVPSLWEYGRYDHNVTSQDIPSLDEEVGLFTQRGVIRRKRDDPNDDRIFL